MEIQLSPEKQARLQEFANRTGKNPEQVVADAVDQVLEYDIRFIAAIELGRASARQGNLIEHDAVVEQIEQILQR